MLQPPSVLLQYLSEVADTLADLTGVVSFPGAHATMLSSYTYQPYTLQPFLLTVPYHSEMHHTALHRLNQT